MKRRTITKAECEDVNVTYRRVIQKEYNPEARATLGTLDKNLREYIERNQNKIRNKVTPHGIWRHIPSLQNPFRYSCSLCQFQIMIPPDYRANYCPNCGARMDGAD